MKVAEVFLVKAAWRRAIIGMKKAKKSRRDEEGNRLYCWCGPLTDHLYSESLAVSFSHIHAANGLLHS